MTKKILFIALFLSTILFSFMVGNIIDIAKAISIIQWRFDASPIITIQSPENNKTYSPDNFILVFNLTKPTADLGGYPYSNNWYEPIQGSIDGNDFGNRVVNATYYIDGQPSNVSIEVNSHLLSPFNYSLPLNSLTDGRHSLQICLFCNGVEGLVWMAGGNLNYDDYFSYSEIVNFSFSTPPSIAVLPIENKTYIVSGVPLTFIISKPTSQITYSLDGQSNITIAGNTTLTGLSSGLHNVTVYAEDMFGNIGASATVVFKAEPFPTALIVIASVVTVAIVVGLLIYFKKRKHQTKMAEVQ
jgi:hypothetical protein